MSAGTERRAIAKTSDLTSSLDLTLLTRPVGIAGDIRSKVDLKKCSEKSKTPGFCVLKSKGREGTYSTRGEARQRLIQTPVKQQNHFSDSLLTAASGLSRAQRRKRIYFKK